MDEMVSGMRKQKELDIVDRLSRLIYSLVRPWLHGVSMTKA